MLRQEPLTFPYIPGYSGYATSKLALIKIMDYVQRENSSLDVFNMQPGLIESDMSRKSDLDMTEKDDICESPFHDLLLLSCSLLSIKSTTSGILRVACRPGLEVPQRESGLGQLGCEGVEGKSERDCQ